MRTKLDETANMSTFTKEIFMENFIFWKTEKTPHSNIFFEISGQLMKFSVKISLVNANKSAKNRSWFTLTK